MSVAKLERLPTRLMPAWLRPAEGEQRLSMVVAVFVAIAMQWLLPARFTLDPRWALLGARPGRPVRPRRRPPRPARLFPQMGSPGLADPEWRPMFGDYLYVSFTNATAFSPTDTLPMSRWAETLMAVQSAVALITVALVVARAVNILK